MFGRSHDMALPWLAGDAEPNADFWAAPDETRDDIVALYRRTWEVADAAIIELPLDAVGHVPWWGNGAVTLHHVLVHVTASAQRHAGHADIVREFVDGSAGLLEGNDNLPSGDPAWWADYHDRVDAAARVASGT